MKTLVRTTALAVAAIAIGAPLAVSAAMAGSTTSPVRAPAAAGGIETMTLAFPWEGGHLRFIDRGKTGISAGDLFLGTDLPVLDYATGDKIGSSDMVELIVSARHDGTVTSESTLRLPGGHVNFDGVVRHTDAPFRVTVVGGTGRYLGVGGQLTLLREDTKHKLNVMKLELVR